MTKKLVQPGAKTLEESQYRAMESREILAANIIAALERKKMSQKDLAAATALSTSYISMLLRKQREPTFSTLHAIALALGFRRRIDRLLAPKERKAADEPVSA